ncbi:hypothetical protein [Streptomyces orinoci]|uniref:Uncharacterized protein n=1 Tax=Streptomyces orinoci TaxID=67339 RepID=A0ABV3JPQ9_STRON|nr:hypothetical protein [Streptomyces orinoci]
MQKKAAEQGERAQRAEVRPLPCGRCGELGRGYDEAVRRGEVRAGESAIAAMGRHLWWSHPE